MGYGAAFYALQGGRPPDSRLSYFFTAFKRVFEVPSVMLAFLTEPSANATFIPPLWRRLFVQAPPFTRFACSGVNFCLVFGKSLTLVRFLVLGMMFWSLSGLNFPCWLRTPNPLPVWICSAAAPIRGREMSTLSVRCLFNCKLVEPDSLGLLLFRAQVRESTLDPF